MGLEIERKFLVKDESWRPLAVQGHAIRQGYLSLGGEATVRVREKDTRWFLTIKGPAAGPARAEYEYPLPPQDGPSLLALCGPRIVTKVRHVVPFAGQDWEVDVFSGDNAGLILAECELASLAQVPLPPPWLGPEVTADHRYSNSQLSLHPFRRW